MYFSFLSSFLELLLKMQHVPKTQYLSDSSSQWVSSEIILYRSRRPVFQLPRIFYFWDFSRFSDREDTMGVGERARARRVGIRLNSSLCQSQVKQLHLETAVGGDIVYSVGKQSSAGRANRHQIILWEAFSGAGCRHRFVHRAHLCEILTKLK